MFVGVSCGGEFWGLDVFAAVERLGYDGLFTGEHVVSPRPVWDAVTMCTAMACATERIAIGPAATIAPLRHPTLLAKELAGIDLISGGRLIVALGAGGDDPAEFAAAGVPLERRGRRTSETMEILRRYFSGEEFSYDGDLYRLDRVRLLPPPAQAGGPPLWVAGRAPVAQRRAARLGDGFLPYLLTPNGCARAFQAIREHAAGRGRALPDGFAWGAHLYLALADDAGEGRRRANAHMAWRYREPRFEGDLADRYTVAGDGPDCVEGLVRYAAAGCSHLVLFLIRGDGEPPLHALERVAAEVVEPLRAAV